MFFKPDSFKDYLLHLIIMISLGSGIMIYFFNFYLPEYTIHGQELEVPALDGKRLAEAEQILASSNLKYQIIDSVYMQEMEPGKVISHHPAKGSKVKSNRKIYLTVSSKKPIEVELPDLINKTYKQANLALSQLGLSIKDTIIVPDQFPLVLKVRLNGKEVKAGTKVPKYSKLQLTIGNGLLNAEDE